VTRLSRFLEGFKRLSLWRAGGLGIALGLLVLQSCLVPQSIQSQFVGHVPPMILATSLSPDGRQGAIPLYVQGQADVASGCSCAVELSLSIEEDDPSLSLTGYWFVDYDSANPTTTVIAQSSPLTAPADSSITRRITPFVFDPLGRVSSGLHYVDFVVAESDGYDTSPDAGLPNRSVKNGYTAAEFRWLIQVDEVPDPARPQCPEDETLAIHRTCK
jgi:hypothetical protein